MPWFMIGWTVLLSAGRLPDAHSIWARSRRIYGHSAGAQHQSPSPRATPYGFADVVLGVDLIEKVRSVEIDTDPSERPGANRCGTIHRNVGPRGTALYFYRPSAAVLEERLAAVLASHTLTQRYRTARRFTVITQVVNDFSPPQERNTHVTQSYGAAH